MITQSNLKKEKSHNNETLRRKSILWVHKNALRSVLERLGLDKERIESLLFITDEDKFNNYL